MANNNGQGTHATNGVHNGNGNGSMEHSAVLGRTANGIEIRAALIHLTRFSVVFALYDPALVLRTSEVVNEFKIVLRNCAVYSGRAVISHLVSTSAALICEATLEDSWLDVKTFPPKGQEQKLRDEFASFMAESQKNFRVLPEFKVAVADLQMMLMDLRLWLDQLELEIRSHPEANRAEMELNAIQAVEEPLVRMALRVLEQFELNALKVEPHARAAHMSYMKRQIHPLVLCAPFIHRTFYKPLGYAGDYEMVNMMVRNPYEGGSMFAKILNRIFLSTPPVEAHRNRLVYLVQLLWDETLRLQRSNQPLRVLNMGCGPAKEIQDFLARYAVPGDVNFTLIDFNEETIGYTGRVLSDLKRRYDRPAKIQLVKKSVYNFIKESARTQGDFAQHNVIYCAGLFDYLPDPVCKKVLNIFYDLLAPGGLMIATNVSDTNPSKGWMEYVLDWHLIYRDAASLAALAPDAAPAEQVKVSAVGTGVNIFLEVRKPDDAQ